MIQTGSGKTFIEQLRAARGLLGWSQTTLASRAKLSLPTVKRVEGGFGPRVLDEPGPCLAKPWSRGPSKSLMRNGAGTVQRNPLPLPEEERERDRAPVVLSRQGQIEAVSSRPAARSSTLGN